MIESTFDVAVAEKAFKKHYRSIGFDPHTDDFAEIARGNYIFGWDDSMTRYLDLEDAMQEIIWAVDEDDKEWLNDQIIRAKKIIKELEGVK